MNSKKFYFITCSAIFLIIFILSEYFIKINAQAHRSNTPLTVGWIFSIPWDIANTLRAPLAGPLSIILAGGLALIMMFGLLVAPVYYLFGTPERPYHFHDATKHPIDVVSRSLKNSDGLVRLLDYTFKSNSSSDSEMSLTLPRLRSNSTSCSDADSDCMPSFLQSAFFFFPENDEQCKKLMVCHAHGFLGFMPDQILRIFRFFSKKIPFVPESYQEAIYVGLDDQESCQYAFDCSKDISDIAKSTLFHIFPRTVPGASPWDNNL